MKNLTSENEDLETMRDHYDLSKLKFKGQGLYYRGNKKKDHLVPIKSKFWQAFPSNESINKALELALSVSQFIQKNKMSATQK